MKEFFSSSIGNEFVEFGFLHFLMLFTLFFVPVILYKFKDKIRQSKNEKKLRYTLASIGIFFEVSLYIWILINVGWNWAENLPFLSLCGLSLYLGIAMMFTKSYRIFEIGYFWSVGAIVSVLFPDIVYSFDRYRFYQFMFGHMIFFYMYMYMLFVHNFIPTIKSLGKSSLILFIYCMIMLVPNTLLHTNALFLKESEGTPFELFEGGPYILYLIGVILTAATVFYVWYLIVTIYVKNVYNKNN